MSEAAIHLGDARTILPSLPDASVDAVVTDPPAGIGFMGVAWDTYGGKSGAARTDDEWDVGASKEHARTADMQGRINAKNGRAFRKFLTTVMAECLRVAKPGAYALVWALPRTSHWTGTAIEDAGWVIQDRIAHLFGQGFPKHRSKLKPACEDWWLAWKPDRYATPLPGLDACRIETTEIGKQREYHPREDRENWRITGGSNGNGATSPLGRWPANLILEEEAAVMLDEQVGPQQSGGTPNARKAAKTKNAYGDFNGEENPDGIGRSEGTVSRFFYVAKASRRDRGEGNTHPTVKPITLMRWLCRLITPPGGTVLDCFMGSGTTGVAALEEHFNFIGIERDPAYFEIAKRRIEMPAGPLFEVAQ